MKDESKIPEGLYCYTYKDDNQCNCPYWLKNKTKPVKQDGYCSLLEYGDWFDDSLTLLWDQCKECGINLGEFEMDERDVKVHAAHCCVLHGCKYNEEKCPVTNKIVKQKYICDECECEGLILKDLYDE